MKFISKRQMALVCAGLGTVGAASAFSFGGTSALFNATAPTQHNNITSGTVTLGSNADTGAFSISNIMPGDTKNNMGAYTLTYSGSNPAFVGLDLDISSTAHNACSWYADPANAAADATNLVPADVVSHCGGETGTLPLFDGTKSAGNLDLSLQPIQSSLGSVPLLVTTNTGSTLNSIVDVGNPSCKTVAAVVTCEAHVKNLMVPIGYYNGPTDSGVQWTNGKSATIKFNVALPLDASNAFQGSGVTLNATGHAVQYENNNTTKPGCSTTVFSETVYGGPCPSSW